LYLGSVRKREIGALQDVIGVFVDWPRVIEGGLASVWCGPARDRHEEEAVFVLAGIGKNLVEECAERGQPPRVS
jgi:hypothetical protein